MLGNLAALPWLAAIAEVLSLVVGVWIHVPNGANAEGVKGSRRTTGREGAVMVLRIAIVVVEQVEVERSEGCYRWRARARFGLCFRNSPADGNSRAGGGRDVRAVITRQITGIVHSITLRSKGKYPSNKLMISKVERQGNKTPPIRNTCSHSKNIQRQILPISA